MEAGSGHRTREEWLMRPSGNLASRNKLQKLIPNMLAHSANPKNVGYRPAGTYTQKVVVLLLINVPATRTNVVWLHKLIIPQVRIMDLWKTAQ